MEVLSRNDQEALVCLRGGQQLFIPLQRLHGVRTGTFGEYVQVGDGHMTMRGARDLLSQRFQDTLAWAQEDGRSYRSHFWTEVKNDPHTGFTYLHAFSVIGLARPEQAQVGEHVLGAALGHPPEQGLQPDRVQVGGQVWRKLEGDDCYLREK